MKRGVAFLPSKHIVLVGLPGVGKSYFGQRLATQLQLPFVDADHALEDWLGVDIAWIFDKEGESGFREYEHQILDRLLNQERKMVIAGGGGVVNQADNRALLQAKSYVIYLCTSLELIVQRIHGSHRPLMKGDAPLEKLSQLQAQRAPWYQELADITLDPGNQEVLKQATEGCFALEKSYQKSLKEIEDTCLTKGRDD